MNRKEMSKLTDEIIRKVISTRGEGQEEYAHDDKDVFANFKRISNLLEIGQQSVLMTYLLKHIDGIAAFVKGHKSQREDVRGRITDCIVYLMLLWGMIEEDDILSGKEDNASLRDVQQKIQDESGDLSLGRGRSTSYRIQPNGSLQEMRTTGDRIKKPEALGRT